MFVPGVRSLTIAIIDDDIVLVCLLAIEVGRHTQMVDSCGAA